jgi:CBS domain-containing protein
MRISQILRKKGDDVATIHRDASVNDALSLLAFRGVGALVVSEDGRHAEGIVSERDIVRALHVRGTDVVNLRVADVMSRLIKTCTPEDHIDELMAMMTELRVRHLPVLVEGELAGIVSIGDVVKARIDELEKVRIELVEYIHAR